MRCFVLKNLDLYLTVGPQATTTYTPTVSFTMTTTPIVTQTVVTVSVFVSTIGPLSTVTVPSETAEKTRTVVPDRVTVSTTSTITTTKATSTKVFGVTTKTATATCNVPGRPFRRDKPMQFHPTRVRVAAQETPTKAPGSQRHWKKSDREVNYEWARSRIEAAKQRRDANAIQRRAADAPTLTITVASNFPSKTITSYAPTVTVTESKLLTQTTTSTLPAATTYKGKYTYTVTLPAPTKTKLRWVTETKTKTYTWGTTYTDYVIVTPPAVAASCRGQGGNF